MTDPIKLLWDEVKDLRRRIMARPTLTVLPTTTGFLTLIIDKGNTLETGQDGINYEASVASVPSAYDPDVTSSFIDGIGRATLYSDGEAQAGYVLVVNSDSGSFRNAMFQNDPFITTGSIQIPVDGGGFVTAYTV